VLLELVQGGLADALSGAAAQGGQAGTETGKIRCVHNVVSIYTYYIDRQAVFSFISKVKTAAPLPADYRQLQRQLAQIGYLSQGSVFKRSPGQQGSRYVWTRKVKAKTVTVALSQQQFHWLRQAVANRRRLDKTVARMQTLSRQLLFQTVPGVQRRKRLGKKVLGII